MCICRNYMLILNSRSTTLNGGLSLSSWMVQLRLSLLLLGLSKGLCSTPSLERLIGNSLIFLLGSFIVQFKVFIDFHCHKDRRLRSLTSRAPADQKKNPGWSVGFSGFLRIFARPGAWHILSFGRNAKKQKTSQGQMRSNTEDKNDVKYPTRSGAPPNHAEEE